MAASLGALLLLLPGCATPPVENFLDFDYLPRGSVADYVLSPNGDWAILAFWNENGHATLVKVDMSTGESQDFLDWPGVQLRSPSVSADGSRLFFLATEFGEFEPVGIRDRVYSMILSSGETTLLAESKYWIQTAAVTPSGNTVVMITAPDDDFDTPWECCINPADVSSVSVGEPNIRRVTHFDSSSIWDLAILDEETALITVHHVNRTRDLDLDGIYDIDIKTGTSVRNSLVQTELPR